MAMSALSASITIRPAYADDERALERLAALDSTDRPPPGPCLLAEVDGELRAVLSLRDGSAVADPFFATAQLLALMRAHAAAGGRADGSGSPSRARRRRLPRLAFG